MTKRTLSGLLVGLVLVGAAWGQTSDGVVTINGGRNTILMRAPSEAFVPAAPASSKLVKIYSNLGKGKNVYNAISGNGILGPDAGQPWPQSVGCGFRPKADHIVTEIQVGRDVCPGHEYAGGQFE
jgi:hypothetical protein